MSLIYHVKIEYKDPEATVYIDMKDTEYPKFLTSYPDQALSKRLYVSKINVVEEFENERIKEIYELAKDLHKNYVKNLSFWKRRKINCKYCGKNIKDWDEPGYIGIHIGGICVCGSCSNKKLEERE